jgi:ribosome-binding protein aMBF1 (putative translation factor)
MSERNAMATRTRKSTASLRNGSNGVKRRAKVRLPKPDADGNYPAGAAIRAILAQQIIGRREAAGWTQAELAEHAGLPAAMVRRLESGKHAANIAAVDRIDRALRAAGA